MKVLTCTNWPIRFLHYSNTKYRLRNWHNNQLFNKVEWSYDVANLNTVARIFSCFKSKTIINNILPTTFEFATPYFILLCIISWIQIQITWHLHYWKLHYARTQCIFFLVLESYLINLGEPFWYVCFLDRGRSCTQLFLLTINWQKRTNDCTVHKRTLKENRGLEIE
jgi:hypothetical protein